MGSIHKHNLKDLINRYELTVFVETGTFRGRGVIHALNFDFKEIHSIELLNPYYQAAKLLFNSIDNVYIHPGRSDKVLSSILPRIEGRILFWLDAHLPSNHIPGLYSQETELPLVNELKVIKDCRDISGDVFIIDDLRIYLDGPFENGNWPRKKDFNLMSSGFIDMTFAGTHEIEKDYRDEGYLIAIPKG
jgi:hypothetical protein